jgi:hypothetical protein
MLTFKIVYSFILKDSDADVLHIWSLVSGLSPPSLLKKHSVLETAHFTILSVGRDIQVHSERKIYS